MNLDKHLTRSRNNTTWCYLQNIENFPFPFSNMGTEEDAAGMVAVTSESSSFKCIRNDLMVNALVPVPCLMWLLPVASLDVKHRANKKYFIEKGKKKMKVNYKQFEIKTFYRGDKCWNCDNRNYNNHIVTVKNTESGKATRFEFWCSIMHPEFETEYDVLNAFYCFVSDALSGLYSFDEFCGEFGYDPDSRKAEKVYKACKRAFAKFERVSGFSENEMYDFINELSEIAA